MPRTQRTPAPDQAQRDAAIHERARNVLIDFRDAVRGQITRGATEDQAVVAVLLPQYRNMVGYDQPRTVLVRRMSRGLKGTLN